MPASNPRLTRSVLLQGSAVLARRDPALGRWMGLVGTPGLRRQPHRFGALCRSIIAQQISAHAARAIHARFVALFDPPGRPVPPQLLALPEPSLRTCGLSARKIAYLRALAEAFHGGPLAGLRLGALPDEAVVDHLTRLPGIGIWTAEMFLIFSLGRPDIFSVRDLALRNGVQRVRGRTLTHAEILDEAARWTPYRSVASLYLWKIAHSREEPPSGTGRRKPG